MKKVFFALLAAAGLAPLSAYADTIQIQVSGLNLTYYQANDEICDSSSCLGGSVQFQDPNDTDPLIELAILIDGSAAESTSNAFADIILSLNGTTVLGGIFDFIWDDGTQYLATNITDGTVIFLNGMINVVGSGFSNIFSQAVSGVSAVDPVNWSFSTGLGTCAVDEFQGQVCTYSGTGELTFSSVSVPEPGTLALLGLGLIGIGFGRRRTVL